VALKAVLFDVGGPLDMEVEHERLIDLHSREALAAEGVEVDDDAYAAASQWAVEVFAPNTYAALVWCPRAARRALRPRPEARPGRQPGRLSPRAARVGMRAVLLRTGRHAGQQPRYPREIPDAEVRDVAGLREALLRLV
jgi:hypothetical protein